jgi:hypothetical protein
MMQFLGRRNAPGSITLVVRAPDKTGLADLTDTVAAEICEWMAEAETARLKRLEKTLAAQIAKQVSAVEESRLKMLDVLKRHGIVDLYPFEPEPAPFEPPYSVESIKGLSAEMERLKGLNDEQLIAAIETTGMVNSILLSTYPEYQRETAELRDLTAGGAGDDDPEVISLKRVLVSRRAQLLKGMKSYRDSLPLRIEDQKKQIERSERERRERAAKGKSPKVPEADALRKRSEYETAKYGYEAQLRLLSTMREYVLRKSVGLESPVHLRVLGTAVVVEER